LGDPFAKISLHQNIEEVVEKNYNYRRRCPIVSQVGLTKLYIYIYIAIICNSTRVYG